MNFKPVHGFVMAALFAVCAAGCGTLSDSMSSPPGQDAMVSEADHQLTLDILHRLQNDSVANESNFGVVSRSGVVTIYGSVADEGMRRRVLSIVQGTPGVMQIHDRLMR
jgi:osmotically-inducible protein OsmY